MDISVVILTSNSENYIEKCFLSVINDLEASEYCYEILLVDNGSKDKTMKIIHSFRDKYPNNILLVSLKKNMGTTYPRNIALKKSCGEYILLMDSDIELFEGTISELLNFLKCHPEAGIAAPRLLYPNGNLQKSHDEFPTIFSKLKRLFFLRSIEKKESECVNDNKIIEVDYAISALWAFRREMIEKVGLLDEKIFYSPEDVDYCFRTWKAGYKVFYNANVSSVHHAQEISRGIVINRAKVDHFVGLFYYFRKHKYFLRKPRNIGAMV